jgi:hypothetical protein
MEHLTKFINEGFFGNKYLRYKAKVADILTSLGIVIDPSRIKKAEDWIHDFFVDGVDAFDCARSLRDDLRRTATVTESVEQYAADIIDSAPDYRRMYAVKLLHKATRLQKDRFDRITDRIAETLKIDLKTVIGAYGFELLELIYGNMLTDDDIVEKYAAMGYLLAKRDMKKDLGLREALEILEDTGIGVSSGSFIKDLYAALQREFAKAEVENTVQFDEASKKIYITDDDDPWLEITYIPSADKVCLENHQHSGEYVEYYPKLQGGADGIANRIRNKYGNAS